MTAAGPDPSAETVRQAEHRAAEKALRDVADELDRANSGWRRVLNIVARYEPSVSAEWLRVRADQIEHNA